MKRTSLTRRMGTDRLSESQAVFPVELRSVYLAAHSDKDPVGSPRSFDPIPDRRAVVRTDTDRVLSVVSDRYTLVTHEEVVRPIEKALDRLGMGDAPRRVHLDRSGARIRALFKIESEKFRIGDGDELCPVIRVTNSYGGDNRVQMSLGAFRFVCTNLMVGGPGIFAEGFRTMHVGEIDTEEISERMAETLQKFPQMAYVFAGWHKEEWTPDRRDHVLETISDLPARHRSALLEGFSSPRTRTVWDAYNAGTHYATHRTRTANVAYQVLTRVNRAFDAITSLN